MSGQIKALIESYRATHVSLDLPLAEAAEAELQHLCDGNTRYTEGLERLAERRREVEQLTQERDRYKRVVDAVSTLDSVKVQRLAMEVKRG